jgi:hypothetical protein
VTPGVVGTLQNSQCSVDAGASSVSGSGNNLTVNLVLTFKAAFAGSKNTYMQVQDVSSTLAPWLARGVWTNPVAGPPVNVSVSPASGSGATQTFSFIYSDPAGSSDIGFVDFLFQTTFNGSNACFAVYIPSTNVINMLNDAGTAIANSATPGVPGTLSSSQCSIDVGATSVSVSGNNLTFSVALTFKPAFGGAKNIYMVVGNKSNVASAWQAEGTWTTPLPGPPVNVSASPASGSGAVQTFSFVYSDPSGNSDIGYVDFLFQTTVNGSNACYAVYVPSSNVINMLNDAGTTIASSATPGVAGTLNSSQCSIDVGASSVSVSGNNLTLTVALTFKPAFAGAKNIYMVVSNKNNVTSTWQAEGVWTVPPPGPPTNVSVSPASGLGTVQNFSFIYFDPLGNSDIGYVDFLFQTTLNGSNACYAVYVPSSNIINILNDAGTAIASSATPGVPGTLSSSQCSIDVGATSVSLSGNNLTLTVALTFKPAFAGAKNIYMVAGNKSNITSGWQAKGVWTVSNPPPVNVSVSPSFGSGTVQNFSLIYSDPVGSSDIGYVDFLFQTTLNGSNACYAVYVPSSNVINMLNDAGTAIAGSATPGIPGTLSSSQCSIDVGATSVSASGNNLTLTVALTFKPAFAGAKNIYMVVGNKSNVTSGWQAEGAWTAQ